MFIVLCLLVISLTAAHAEVHYSKRNKTLSVTSEGQNLADLLYDIMEETGIHMEIAEGVEGTVYEDFQGLTIEEGLKRILKTQNYSFLYLDNSIRMIYVFPGGVTETPGTASSSSMVKPVPRTQ